MKEGNRMNETIISVDHVVKKFGTETVLKDISFQIEKGKIYGIIGRNGSGKTVLFKCICGLLNIDAGKIQVDRTQLGVIIEEPGWEFRCRSVSTLVPKTCTDSVISSTIKKAKV